MEPATTVQDAPLVAPTPEAPRVAVRGAVDALVQVALVDLFQAYQVPLAPLPRTAFRRAPTIPEISAAIPFASSARSSRHGRLTLSIPKPVLEQMAEDPARPLGHADWARELANQLMGRIKNRLLQFSVKLTLGIPSDLDPKRLEGLLKGSTALRVYPGRTLRGQVLATLEGLPKEAELVYVGPACVAAEGDAILF